MSLKKILYITATLLTLALSSCLDVTSKHPVGLSNHNLTAESWEGTWKMEDELFKIEVIDATNGVLKIIWIRNDKKVSRPIILSCHLKKGKTGLYFNIPDIPEPEFAGFCVWGKIQKNDNTLQFWLPSFKAFQEALKTQKLKAKTEIISHNKTELLKLNLIKLIDDPSVIVDLVESDPKKYFGREASLILKRVGY